MSKLYCELDESKAEVRLLTLLPESRTTGLIHCTLETQSLEAFTPDYLRYLSTPGTTNLGKRRITSQWAKSRIAPELAGLAPLNRVHATEPLSSQHRFVWGDYAALSYVWGDEHDTTTIILNGQQSQVTQSLARALWTFCREGKFEDDFKLWVDAICINQDDLDERARQLRRMREIYGSAWAVIAWLGEESFRSNSAMQLIRDLSALSEAGCGGLIEACLRSEPGSLGKGCWLALQELMDRPYWSRLWIIQEMIMGASATWIMCGTSSIDWASFLAGIAFVEEHLWFVKDSLLLGEMSTARKELTPKARLMRLPWSVTSLHLVYSDLSPLSDREERGGRPPSFGRLLDIASSANCKDPRDKVYALVGLMPPGVAGRLRPDYKLAVPSVYAATTQAFIQGCDLIEPILEGNPWGPSNAPSWAADWLWPGRLRWSRTEGQVWGPTGLFPKPESSAPFHVPYTASGNTKHDTSFSSDGLLLTCSGCIVDSVDGLCARGTGYFACDENSIIQPENWSSAYGDRNATAEALYRTLVMDRVAGGEKASARHSAIFSLPRTFKVEGEDSEFAKRGWTWLAGQDSYYLRWEMFRAVNGEFQLGEYRLDDFFTETMPSDASEYDYSEVYSCFDRSFLRRRFMATGNGYIGWAPDNIFGDAGQETKRGDLVAVLFGCSTPIIIRPHGPYFQVIGEAYVQGLMEGEVMEAMRIGKFQGQSFTFC